MFLNVSHKSIETLSHPDLLQEITLYGAHGKASISQF